MARLRAVIFCAIFLDIAYSNADPVLLIEPSNMTVGMGDTVRFRCRVDSTLGVTVNWIRGDTVISNNGETYNNIDVGRYSVIRDTENDFNLQIIDIKPYDEAPFKCQAIEDEGSGSAISRVASLTVHYPPGNSLTCRTGTGSNRFKVGDFIEPFCILFGRSEPPAELQWVNMDGTNVTSVFKNQHGPSSLVLRFNRTLTVEDDGKEFRCVVLHPLLTEPTECKIGPINVFYAPFNATISPVSLPTVTVHEGEDVEFSCSANFNHEQGATFTWSTNPSSKGHKITYANDERTMIRFTKVSVGLNGTTLTCNVTNQDGFSADSTIIYVIQDAETPTTQMKPTKSLLDLPTSSPVNFPNTYIIVFILMGVIFVLLLGIVVILVIGRKWREPVIVLDINEEVCRRSLSGGGSLVFGSGSHSIVLQHHSHNGDRHLFEVHQGKKDGYSIASSASCCSHHSQHPEDHEDHPSDPQKAAKIEGTGFYRSAHTSRHNSVDSACSGDSHYERSICSSLNGSRPSTPSRLSQDPLPPIPGENITMVTLDGNHLLTLEDEDHHAEKNYYMNSPKRKKEDRSKESRDHDTSSKRESGEHKYEDVTPVTKRKLYSQEVDTGEDDFPDDDKPRITPEQQFGEISQDLLE